MLNYISEENLSSVIDSSQVVLIHCHAQWSAPSQRLMTILEKISEEYQDNVFIGTLDIDDSPVAVESYNIKAIPELLYFANGELMDRVLGIPEKSVISGKLSRLLARR